MHLCNKKVKIKEIACLNLSWAEHDLTEHVFLFIKFHTLCFFYSMLSTFLYNKHLISCRVNYIVILAFKIGTSFKYRIKLCFLFALCVCSLALPRPKSRLVVLLSHQNRINQLFYYSLPWLMILLSYQNCEVFKISSSSVLYFTKSWRSCLLKQFHMIHYWSCGVEHIKHTLSYLY
jgi:hypothetical protein